MDFKDKIKKRIINYCTYTALGIIMILISMGSDNDILQPFGAAFALMGIARAVHYSALTKNPAALKKREIAENDERNIDIAVKARSLTFTVFGVCGGLSVIALKLLKLNDASQTVAYTLCAMLVIYWLCYFAIKKKY